MFILPSRLPVYDADDEVTPKNSKMVAHPDQSKCWADSLIGGILMFTDETDPPEDAVLFAQISPFKPTPITAAHTSYADSHWTDGRPHIDPPPDVLHEIDSYIRNNPAIDMSRYGIFLIPFVPLLCSLYLFSSQIFPFHSPCITHPTPRYCSLSGNSIVEQLYGNKLLDHEACCLLFRRLNQIDRQSLYPGSTPKWRCFIEADFSVWSTFWAASPWTQSC